jgi:predicted TIM-barrel fold metal-dependent hydrolase
VANVFDADAHVEESPDTFSDDFLDPEYRERRPQVVGMQGYGPVWVIDQQLYPRRSGRGAHHFSTPASIGEMPTDYMATKRGSLGSATLADVHQRLGEMDADGIESQVIYPTLFLKYPLTEDARFGNALCRSYNRWIREVCGRSNRLLWVCTVDLGDVAGAIAELKRSRADGAVGCMILGTVGDDTLDKPRFEPFFAAAADLDVALAVHVGWSSPAISSLYENVYDALVMPFAVTLMTGFMHIVSSGILDRHPGLRVCFFEAGCEWVPFLLDRMDHNYEMAVTRKRWAYRSAYRPVDYLRRGSVYVGFEVEEGLLPYGIQMLGEDRFVYASDIPHGDREWDSVTKLRERTDLSETAKSKLLRDNGLRLYGLTG